VKENTVGVFHILLQGNKPREEKEFRQCWQACLARASDRCERWRYRRL